jgi:hypothetical protein
MTDTLSYPKFPLPRWGSASLTAGVGSNERAELECGLKSFPIYPLQRGFLEDAQLAEAGWEAGVEAISRANGVHHFGRQGGDSDI